MILYNMSKQEFKVINKPHYYVVFSEGDQPVRKYSSIAECKRETQYTVYGGQNVQYIIVQCETDIPINGSDNSIGCNTFESGYVYHADGTYVKYNWIEVDGKVINIAKPKTVGIYISTSNSTRKEY